MTRVNRPATLLVSQSNLHKTAIRVLNGQPLVSTEVDYVMRSLGARATQQDLDAMVLRVRSMAWASIVRPE